MIRWRRITPGLLILALVVTGVTATSARAADPFRRSAIAPADTTFFVHIERPAKLRQQLAERPICDAFAGPGLAAALTRAFQMLAVDAQLSSGAFFDLLFQREVTLIARTRPHDDPTDLTPPPLEWVLLTEIDAAGQHQLVDKKLRFERQAPRWRIPVARLSDHDLLFASDGQTCLIGSATQSDLLNDCIRRLTDDTLPVLANHAALKDQAVHGEGADVVVLVRHAEPMGGWSRLRITLDGDDLVIDHRGAYDYSPMGDRPRTTQSWDASPLEAFRGHGLAAVMEPTDLGPGALGRFLENSLGVGLLRGQHLRGRTGERRIVAVGEIDGRGEPERSDLLIPAFSMAVQAQDRETAAADLDLHLRHLTRAINSAGENAFRVEYPSRAALASRPQRHVDLSPAKETLWGTGSGFPIMQAVSLEWTVVDGSEGAWWILASHPQQLEETARALREGKAAHGPEVCREAVGIFDGQRLGFHLSTWRDQAALLAADDEALRMQFTDMADWLSRVCHGLGDGRWELCRPSDQEASVHIEVELIGATGRTAKK